MGRKGDEMRKIQLFLAAAAAATLAGNDGVFRYDFGRADSPLREGFIRVTHGKGKGYQWRSSAKLTGSANKITESAENKRRKTIEAPQVYFNELSCDHVSGKGDALLLIRVLYSAPRGTAGRLPASDEF